MRVRVSVCVFVCVVTRGDRVRVSRLRCYLSELCKHAKKKTVRCYKLGKECFLHIISPCFNAIFFFYLPDIKWLLPPLSIFCARTQKPNDDKSTLNFDPCGC